MASIREEFDAELYYSENPDVAWQGVDPVMHYVKHGSKEGRRPNRNFDPAFYKARYGALPPGTEAFHHFLNEGRGLGYLPKAREDFHVSESLAYPNGVTPSRRPKNDKDYALAVPFATEIASPRFERVAAVVHAFYPELMPEIFNYLDRIPGGADVFITTDEPGKAHVIEAAANGFRKGTVEVHVKPNRGRDLGPFVDLLPRICDHYQVVLHAHTKKSPHGGDPLEQWRPYLLDNLLGTPEIVASIFATLQTTRTGLVFPQHLFEIRGILNWGFDFDHASALLRRVGVKIDKDMILEFPSGSMFWAKTEALRSLAALGLTAQDFEVEAGQVDGTLAHAIERTLLLFVEQAGFAWAKVLRSDVAYPHPDCVLPVASNRDLTFALSKVYRPLLQRPVSGTSAAERAIPESRALLFYPSTCKRPRITLLVPSINPHHIFGGISTALRLFRELERTLADRCDFRVVTTDAVVEKQSLAGFPGYDLERLGAYDFEGSRVVVDAYHREFDPLNLRENDTFIATAWWTAAFASDASRAQAQFFGTGADYVYLIQDYEPNFYGWSSKWVLAENTYRAGNNAIAIINSEELFTSFQKAGHRFKASFCLPYTLNETIGKLLNPRQREKVILLYGRPSVSRNLFEILIDGVALWQRRNPTTASHWRILSAGELYPDSYCEPVQNIAVLGKLSLDEYAHWLNRASLGIVLMASPHPSYPPLEMAEAGLATITNAFDSKDLTRRSPNIVSIETVDPEAISDALETCVARLAHGGRMPEVARVPPSPVDRPGFEYYSVEALMPFLKGVSQAR